LPIFAAIESPLLLSASETGAVGVAQRDPHGYPASNGKAQGGRDDLRYVHGDMGASTAS
jgi:hypothetical protein